MILVCEADAGVQEAFRLLLEDWAAVRMVAEADACLRKLSQASVELFILDLDGQAIKTLDFLRTIRQRSPHLHVLVVAGDFDLDFQRAALKCAPISFLTKPFHPPATVERLQTLTGYAPSSIQKHVMQVVSADEEPRSTPACIVRSLTRRTPHGTRAGASGDSTPAARGGE